MKLTNKLNLKIKIMKKSILSLSVIIALTSCATSKKQTVKLFSDNQKSDTAYVSVFSKKVIYK